MKGHLREVVRTCWQMLILAAIFSALYIILSLILKGHVDWA